MDHVLLTRFNLPSRGRERTIREQPGWLASRVELFERYCLPSVAAQSNATVHWIIYFDPASPTWLRERIEAHATEGRYSPHFREEVSPEELLEDLQRVVRDRSDELLTTNLDNDDALASDFCERLQAQPRPAETTAYYVVDGLVRSADGLRLHRDPDNAFPSVRTPWDVGTTCWSKWHNDFRRWMPVVEIGGGPGWLQVVHDRNVSNRARGRLVSPVDHAARFPGLLDDLAPPSRAARWRDRLVRQPARDARDTAVRVLKPVVFRVLGPTGHDRIRQALARRRS